MRTKIPFLGLLAALSFLALGQIPVSSADKRVEFKVENVDVREGLRTIFKQVGVSYTISPEVQGTVKADFRGLVLDDALSVVLRQVGAHVRIDGAHVRIDGGIYQIVPNEKINAGSDPTDYSLLIQGPPAPSVEPTVVTSDVKALYVVRFGVVHKIDKATMKEVGKLDLNDRKIRIVF